MQHDTPDEIFDRFPILADSSLENNTGWSIQLCSYYLVVFSKDLQEHVTTESKFVIPDLTKLTTEILQIDALREIQNHASMSYKVLSK